MVEDGGGGGGWELRRGGEALLTMLGGSKGLTFSSQPNQAGEIWDSTYFTSRSITKGTGNCRLGNQKALSNKRI